MSQTKRANLADFVKRMRASKGLSLKDVVNRSGGNISNGYISKIETGDSANLSVDKLQALAKGLGADENEVFAIARGVMDAKDASNGNSTPAILYGLGNQYIALPPEIQAQLDTMVEAAELFIRSKLKKKQ